MAPSLPPVDFADTSHDPWSREAEEDRARGAKRQKRGHRKLAVLAAVFAVLIAVAAAGLFYCENGYEPTGEALAASARANGSPTEEGWLTFGDETAAHGIVFYPGARVDSRAYAPLMEQLAGQGMFCVLVDMPFNMAFFDIDAADGVQGQFPQVGDWYLAGHSLGGAMAASYLASCADDWAGLILLAAYSTADLSGTSLAVLSVTGTNDGVVNRSKQGECAVNLPDGAQSVTIEGGNHADFGSYGNQKGDNPADISTDEQQEETAQAVASFIEEQSAPSWIARALIEALVA